MNQEQSDFLRYISGEMTGRERNAFEKKLQKDSFAEEAYEGLITLPPGEASKDMDLIQKRLKGRTTTRRKLFIYRIAASVAVLMVISSVFLIIERNRPGKQLTETAVSQVLEIQESKPLTSPVPGEKRAEKVTGTGLNTTKSPDKKISTPEDNKILQVTGVRSEGSKSVSQIPEDKTKHSEKFAADEIAALPVTAKAYQKADTRIVTREMEAISKPELKASDDTLIAVRDEVVVVGYGIPRYKSVGIDSVATFLHPQPAIGETAYEKYVIENLQHPDSASAGQRMVVVLSFMVRRDGKIDSIKIVKSPGKSFSDEAIRLIKSGPAWIPAMSKGKAIDDTVRLKIEFR